MLKEVLNTYQLTFRHEDADEDITVYATIPYSNDSMAVFKIFSPNLWYDYCTYIMSWYEKQCWLIDPSEQTSAFFEIPLDIEECIDELIDKDFEDDAAEEMANVIRLVHSAAVKDLPQTESKDNDLPF